MIFHCKNKRHTQSFSFFISRNTKCCAPTRLISCRAITNELADTSRLGKLGPQECLKRGRGETLYIYIYIYMYLLSRYTVPIIGNLCTYLYLHPSLSIPSPRIHFYLYYPSYLLHTIHYYPMIQLAPIWSDSYHFVPFHSIPFYFVPFRSVPFSFARFSSLSHSVPFRSIPFYSVLFYFCFPLFYSVLFKFLPPHSYFFRILSNINKRQNYRFVRKNMSQ